MSLNTIQINGQEFALIPIANYKNKKKQIDKLLTESAEDNEYVPLVLEEVFQHPVILARIKVGVTQAQLAALMGVSQAYISQIEKRPKVTDALMRKVKMALQDYSNIWDDEA